jgi:hypothetical protein
MATYLAYNTLDIAMANPAGPCRTRPAWCQPTVGYDLPQAGDNRLSNQLPSPNSCPCGSEDVAMAGPGFELWIYTSLGQGDAPVGRVRLTSFSTVAGVVNEARNQAPALLDAVASEHSSNLKCTDLSGVGISLNDLVKARQAADPVAAVTEVAPAMRLGDGGQWVIDLHLTVVATAGTNPFREAARTPASAIHVEARKDELDRQCGGRHRHQQCSAAPALVLGDFVNREGRETEGLAALAQTGSAVVTDTGSWQEHGHFAETAEVRCHARPCITTRMTMSCMLLCACLLACNSLSIESRTEAHTHMHMQATEPVAVTC